MSFLLIFFQRKRFNTNKIKNVSVYGGGLMGSGIAQVAAQGGYNVTLVDVNNEAIEKSKKIIQDSLKRILKVKFKDEVGKVDEIYKETFARIKGTTDPVEGVKDSDLVIEAIIENIKKKQDLFKILDANAKPHTIFASNTSSLSISKIAEATKRRDRFGGIHFFNPVPIMKLVEVVKGKETSESTVQALQQFGKSINKVVITCKDTPGFVVNRLLVPYLNESIKLLERGVASKEDIDTAMKLGAGYPMGPFELLDYVGLDTSYYILEGWSKEYPNEELFKPSPLVKDLVGKGKFGKKSGEGFYKHTKP